MTHSECTMIWRSKDRIKTVKGYLIQDRIDWNHHCVVHGEDAVFLLLNKREVAARLLSSELEFICAFLGWLLSKELNLPKHSPWGMTLRHVHHRWIEKADS